MDAKRTCGPHKIVAPQKALRLIPIFDTNVFGLRDESSLKDLQFLLRHRPRHGWPLSLVTVLELLAGLDGISSEKFPDLRAQVQLAFDLSKGRVLEEPMPMLCREVLHIPFPSRHVAPSGSTLHRYMDVVRRATTVAQLLKGVPYKGGYASLRAASAINDLVTDLKKQWVNAWKSWPLQKILRGANSFANRAGGFHQKCARKSSRYLRGKRKDVFLSSIFSVACSTQNRNRR